MPTTEQSAVIAHNPDEHGRVLAGPGTGKSWTAVALLERLMKERPELRFRMLTFTRAATIELADKIEEAGLGEGGISSPSTIHSFALSLLIRANQAGLPSPLRIPDKWETEKLIRPDIGRRLAALGHPGGARLVKKLEQEMSAGWEALDPKEELLADVDPRVRNAYVGVWQAHRTVFGYSLLDELPYHAVQALEDEAVTIQELDFLMVDEYQDLNEMDIKLIRLVANAGVRLLAIGDDDQSIYSFRVAAPHGIRRFLTEFETQNDYSLSVCMRSAPEIVDAAASLIETAPDRSVRPRLTARAGMKNGRCVYARFNTQADEATGVARIVKARLDAGVEPAKIAILVRSSLKAWAAGLLPELEERSIPVLSTAWVDEALAEREVRKGLAVAHLAAHREDSMAWWALLNLELGVSRDFVDYVRTSVRRAETFAQSLFRLYPAFDDAPTTRSQRAARSMVEKVLGVVDDINLEGAVLDESGWGGWILGLMDRNQVSQNAERLLREAGKAISPEEGIVGFLGHLQPVGRDLAAALGDSVRIMTISSSKGLTLNTVIVLGVERGIIPLPDAPYDEERRLLYVAMTRASEFTVLTCARRRTGVTARRGEPNVAQPRTRSPLLANLGIGAWVEGRDLVQEIEATAETAGQADGWFV